MGMVKRARSNPALWRALARYFSYRGTEEMPEDEAAAAVAPEALAPRGSGSVWSDSVGLAEEFGMLTRRKGTIRLTHSAWQELASESLSSVGRALMSLVFEEAQNEGLWEGNAKGWRSECARDFSRIASWFLQTGLDRPFKGEEDQSDLSRKEVEGPGGERLVENPTQWGVFERWAVSLGLVTTLKGFPLPDPTSAVAREIESLIEPGERMPSRTLRSRIVERIPVLQGGTYARGLDDFLREDVDRQAHDAGIGLSVALVRLYRAGWIDLAEESDGDRLRLAYTDRAPTSVTLVAQ